VLQRTSFRVFFCSGWFWMHPEWYRSNTKYCGDEQQPNGCEISLVFCRQWTTCWKDCPSYWYVGRHIVRTIQQDSTFQARGVRQEFVATFIWPVFHLRISPRWRKILNLILCSFAPSAKGLTKVEHFQQLERRNNFLQWRMSVKKRFLSQFFCRAGVKTGFSSNLLTLRAFARNSESCCIVQLHLHFIKSVKIHRKDITQTVNHHRLGSEYNF
jgi:hypothetical protein